MDNATIIKIEGDKMWAGEWHKSNIASMHGGKLWHRNGQTSTHPLNMININRLASLPNYKVTVIK